MPNDFTQLPTVAFVIPNLNHDMHGERDQRSWLNDHLRTIIPGLNHDIDERLVRDGDTSLKDQLGSYAGWAKAHNSVLIVTFDEDDDRAGNHIPTIIFGAHVRPDIMQTELPITTCSALFSQCVRYHHSLQEVTVLPISSIWQE